MRKVLHFRTERAIKFPVETSRIADRSGGPHRASIMRGEARGFRQPGFGVASKRRRSLLQQESCVGYSAVPEPESSLPVRHYGTSPELGPPWLLPAKECFDKKAHIGALSAALLPPSLPVRTCARPGSQAPRSPPLPSRLSAQAPAAQHGC